MKPLITKRIFYICGNAEKKNNMRGCKNCRHSLKVNEDEWQYTISKYEDLIKGKNVVFAKGLKEVNGGIWQKNL